MANGLFGINIAAPQLQQSRLAPAGVPDSTFIRPAQQQTGGNLKALADSLQGLNGALQNYGNATARQEQDPQSRANQEWIAKRQLMTTDQLREEARVGSPDGVRIREDALNSLLGEKANDDFRTRWTTFYNTEFDQTSGDAAAEYERMRQETAEALPNDLSKASFYRMTKEHFSSWMQKDTERKVENTMGEIDTAIVGSFRATIDDGLGIHKLTPQQAADAVFKKSSSNREFLGLDGKRQNDTIFKIAEEYALQGNEELARALLEGQRTGADGNKLPSLKSIPAYTDKVIKLLDQSGNIRDQNAKDGSFKVQVEDNDLIQRGAFTKAEADKRRAASPGIYSDTQLANMVDQSRRTRIAIEQKAEEERQRRERKQMSEREEGSVIAQAFSAMTNMNGADRIKDVEIVSPTGEGTRTLTRQTIINQVVNRFESHMADRTETLMQGGMSQEQAALQTNREKMTWYAANKIENDEWSSVLNGIAGRATVENLSERGNVSQKLLEQAELYRTLKAANSPYLSTLLTDKKSKEFLEAFDNAITFRRMSPEDAAFTAASYAAQDEKTKASVMINQSDAAKLAEDALRDIGADARGQNNAYVTARIASMSLSGFTDKEIKQNLQKELEDNYVTINGVMVADNRDLPDDFPELIEQELADRMEVYGKRLGLPEGDLYVTAESGQSKWLVMSKSLGGAIGSSMITPASLEARRNRRRMDQEAITKGMIEASDDKRAEYQQRYNDDIRRQKANIGRFSKRSGFLSQTIAKRLQDNLDSQLNGDREKFEGQLRVAIEDYRKKRDDASKRRMDFFRSLVPSVKIGGKTIID